jgi:hypothetical protein
VVVAVMRIGGRLLLVIINIVLVYGVQTARNVVDSVKVTFVPRY